MRYQASDSLLSEKLLTCEICSVLLYKPIKSRKQMLCLIKVEGALKLLAATHILGDKNLFGILFAEHKMPVGICPGLLKVAERSALQGAICQASP